MNELEAIAAGQAASPMRIGASVLLSMRLSGTGGALRPALNERTFRSPDVWLTQRMCEQMTAVPVLIDHPPQLLDQAEYVARNVGSIAYAYIADRDGIENGTGPDLWGIGRLVLTDDDLAAIRESSTSPCVSFAAGTNSTITLDDGSEVLCEGEPLTIDHIAIVMGSDGAGAAGVCDKGDDQSRGLRFDNTGDLTMADEQDDDQKKREEAARKDAETTEDPMAGMKAKMDAMTKRMDEMTTEKDLLAAQAGRTPRRTSRKRRPIL